MMRYLRQNHRTAAPQSIAAVYPAIRRREDDEKAGRHKYYFAGAWLASCRLDASGVSRETSMRCDTIDCFWSHLAAHLDHKRPLWLWSYNAAEDMTVLEVWQRIIEGEYSLKEPEERWAARLAKNQKAKRQHGLLVTSDPPTIAVLYHNTGRKLIWCDIRNWHNKPLGEIINEEVSTNGKRQPDEGTDEIYWPVLNSCARGILRGVASIAQFVRDNNLGNFRYTAAGQSMAAYRHRFLNKPILVHAHEASRKLEREALYAGQVECFYVGPIATINDKLTGVIHYANKGKRSESCRDIYHIDVNGLYPNVMREHRYPCALVGYSSRMSVDKLAQLTRRLGCVARVQIRSEVQEFPVRHNGQTMACTGSFDTVLCGPELRRAVDTKGISRVYECSIYRMGGLFKRFVDCLWSLRGRYRSEGNVVYADLCKLLSVSIFGKFAQRGAEWVDMPDGMHDEPWGPVFFHNRDTREVIECRSVAHHLQLHRRKSELDGTFIAISAFVTAYGREYMRELRRIMPDKSVYYQGVDSLIVSDRAYHKFCEAELVDSDALGAFKMKGIHKSGIIHGANDYELDGVRVKAGVKYPNTPEGGERWKQEEFARMNTQLSSKAGPAVYSYERMLESRKAYDRGKVGDDGWVVPWNLG